MIGTQGVTRWAGDDGGRPGFTKSDQIQPNVDRCKPNWTKRRPLKAELRHGDDRDESLRNRADECINRCMRMSIGLKESQSRWRLQT